jgi:RecA/RadA recombinase
VSAAADPVFANVLKLAQKQSGKATHFTIRGGRVLYYGLPSPSVALSYGLGSNVIPFGRAVHLVGEKGSFKSACAFDIIRMMLELAETGLLREPSVPLIAGTHRYVENESKPAYDFLLSFLEHRPQYADVLRGHETRFLEEWTEALNDAVADWEALFDPADNGGLGWFTPTSFVVDSLMGSPTRDDYEKFRKEGAPSVRGMPLEAGALTRLSKYLVPMLRDRPTLFIATNHLKEFADMTNPSITKRNTPGGRAFQHVESLELEFRRREDIRDPEMDGAKVEIRFFKNCFGTSRRRIEVEVRWVHKYEDGHKVQYSMWDWPTASIRLLESIAVGKDASLREKVAEVVDINVSAGRIWSNALGISKADKLTRHEAGCVLEESPVVLDALLPAMGVTMGRFFRPGQNYAAERIRTDAEPDSMAERVFRRPAAGDLTRLVAANVDAKIGTYDAEI